MCGVFGILHINLKTNFDTKTQSYWEKTLTTVNDIQKHRGPDEQKYIYDITNRWGFAHQRLALLEISSAGSQPMLSKSNNSVIVFNGEIYNYKDLQKKFSSHQWRGHSDTEVLLECLEVGYEKILTELDGMFAFGYFNKKAKSLLLAVDPAGKKPIYTYWDGHTFAFASEIKTLLSVPEINLEISSESLRQYLIYGYVPYPNTIYKYIRKIPAGNYQWVHYNSGPETPRPYWNLIDYCKIQKINYKDAQEELRYLLRSAVQKRLAADVPVGSFLSGGLDSSIISYLAASTLRKDPIHTFSVSFDSEDIPKEYDESRYARQIANLIKSSHHEVRLDFNSLNSSIILEKFGEPFADSSAIPTYFLCQETAKTMKAVLSGDGGDELFGGYLRFRAGLISYNFGPVLKRILNPIHFQNVKYRSLAGFLMRFKSKLNETLLAQQAAWNTYFDQKDFFNFLNETIEDVYLKAHAFEDETKDLEAGQKILYYNFKTYLYDDLLPKIDRMSMANGLEVRSPFLDKKLIEFAFSLPTRYKFNYFSTKKILKTSYSSIFGSKFVNRRKMGFALPIEKFIDSQNMYEKLDHLKEQPYVTWNNLEHFNKNLPNYYQKAYLVLSLQNYLLHKS